MCITTSRAKLSNTLVYAGEGHYQGQDVHVLAYQNKAENYSSKWDGLGMRSTPNAMVIPFPTSEEMTAANIIDTRNFKSFLKDISNAHKMQSFTLGGGTRGLTKSAALVFDSGSYTVILASDVNQIPKALLNVPENKRPAITENFLHGYGQLYPNRPIAVCCWEGDIEAEPLLWWYKPTDKSHLFLPTMDAHDGNAPDVNAMVKTDHIISIGSADNDRIGHDYQVYYKDRLPKDVMGLLPSYVYGAQMKQMIKNGDMFVDTKNLGANRKTVKEVPAVVRGVSFAQATIAGHRHQLLGWG